METDTPTWYEKLLTYLTHEKAKANLRVNPWEDKLGLHVHIHPQMLAAILRYDETHSWFVLHPVAQEFQFAGVRIDEDPQCLFPYFCYSTENIAHAWQ